MKNGTTVICTNIFKGKTEEEIKKRFNICKENRLLIQKQDR